jgi:RNA ligase (TIGR02306 family)
VTPLRLRGVVSQGLVYKPDTYWAEGAEVSSKLGIQKYVVPVPAHLSGEVFSVDRRFMPHFDVDNVKSFPDMFAGRQTLITEKLHGTFCGITVLPVGQTHPEAFGTNQNILIFSKGLGSRGFVFKNNQRNQDNLYVKVISEYIEQIEARWTNNQAPVHILGEIVGSGVQDLSYTGRKAFFVFAVCVGNLSSTVYMEFHDVTTIARHLGMLTVPVLHIGIYDKKVIQELTDGKTTLGAGHIREGVVVWAQDGQPKALKSISNDYLFRKNGTEYN